MIQRALINYYVTNQNSNALIEGAYGDLQTAIGTQAQILAGKVFTNNFTLIPNLTFSDVSYPFPDILTPTGIPPTHQGLTSITTGQLLGPVSVPATPGSYALSITIPIVNINGSNAPPILGYISAIFTASGLLRAINDTTGMGQTGQLLVVAKNGSHYDVILPPGRRPQGYGQPFIVGRYPAVDMAFMKKSGYLINTNNAAGAPVSVGYNV